MDCGIGLKKEELISNSQRRGAVYRIRKERMEEILRMEGIFSHLFNDKRCLLFIRVDRMRKNSFHSLPFNSVHLPGVKCV